MGDQFIVVTSGSKPSRFSSNFNSVINVAAGYEIGVKSVFHAPVFNVTEENDSFCVTKEGEEVNFSIPHGFYDRSCEILRAAFQSILEYNKSGNEVDHLNRLPLGTPNFGVNADGRNYLRLSKSEKFKVDECPLFEIFGCYLDGNDVSKIEIEDFPLKTTVECGFLYSDTVKHSIINNSFARLMCCIPLYSTKGYNYYEFVNPDYKPLSVNSFTDLSFVITDSNGQDVKFDHTRGCGDPCSSVKLPTILNLHIRPTIT